MTREEKIEAFTMLQDGYTYDQIGKRFGISKQRAHQILHAGPRARKWKWVYPNLKKWITANERTVESIALETGICIGTIVNLLNGKGTPPKKDN